jgi:hypothetical protein
MRVLIPFAELLIKKKLNFIEIKIIFIISYHNQELTVRYYLQLINQHQLELIHLQYLDNLL